MTDDPPRNDGKKARGGRDELTRFQATLVANFKKSPALLWLSLVLAGLATAVPLGRIAPWGFVYLFLLYRDPVFILATSPALAMYVAMQPTPWGHVRALAGALLDHVYVAQVATLAICLWYAHTLWVEIDRKRRALLLREYVEEGKHKRLFRGDARAIEKRVRHQKRLRGDRKAPRRAAPE